MNQSIDAVCTKVGVFPDLFLSAHAHNYQRYTRRIGGKQVPYIVVGTPLRLFFVPGAARSGPFPGRRSRLGRKKFKKPEQAEGVGGTITGYGKPKWKFRNIWLLEPPNPKR